MTRALGERFKAEGERLKHEVTLDELEKELSELIMIKNSNEIQNDNAYMSQD